MKRGQAEATLREQLDLNEAILQTTGALVVVLDPQGGIVGFNRACERTTGYSLDEVQGRCVWDVLLIPEELEGVKAVFADLRAGQFPSAHENYWVAKDGSRRMIAWTNTVVLDDAGSVAHVIGTGIDITEYRRTEEALRRSHETLERRVRERTAELEAANQRLEQEVKERRLVAAALDASDREWQDTSDASKDAVCLIDLDRHILRGNQAMAALANQPVNKILGKSCYEVLHHAEKPCDGCPIGQMIDTRSRVSQTYQRDNSWFQLTLDPMTDKAGNLVGAVHAIADITEQKHLEKLTQMAERELEEQRVLQMHGDRLRSLGEMAAGIAHELNQPLVGVRGLAEHLLLGMERGWDLLPEKVREKLPLVVEQADRMTHIIEHVRVFAREAGKPERCATQVNDVIRSAISMLGAQLQSHGITLATELADGLPVVLANPFSLEEVVLNLISNARDAVEQQVAGPDPKEQPDILIRTQVRRSGKDEYLEFRVIDAGDGIPEEAIERVFEPFFTTKPPGKGTGLGLSICKSIVEQFDGTIEITSESSKGTTVTVSLPASGGIRNSKPEIRNKS